MSIAYDESHDEPKLVEFYSAFNRYLGNQIVPVNAPITPEGLRNFKVLIISFPQKSFGDGEIIAIHNFVANGGGLLLVGEEGNFNGFKDNLNSISSKFGVHFNDDEVHDPTDSLAESYSIIHRLESHEITQNVGKFVIYGGCSFKITGDAKSVATGDDDTFSTGGYYEKGQYPPVLCVSEYQNGRVVCIGDGSLFRNTFINEYGNKQLGINITTWLTHKEESEEKGGITKYEIMAEIGKLEKKYEGLGKELSSGQITDKEYREKMAVYGSRLDVLEKRLNDLG